MSGGGSMLKVTNLSYSFPSKILFENVTFSISNRQKTALIGPNGSGKSTLIKLILNELEPDSGQVISDSHIVFGYVSQVPAKTTLTLSRFLQKNMVENHQFAKQASKLGLVDFKYSKILSHFSGGELSKIMIAVATINNPNFLILDEPTNHLDETGTTWLTSYLKEYSGAVLVVSHDRKFLDEIVDSVLEIDPNSKIISDYHGNFTEYIDQKNSIEQNIEQKNSAIEKHKKVLETNLHSKVHRSKSKASITPKDNDKMAFNSMVENAEFSHAKTIHQLERNIESLKITEISKPGQIILHSNIIAPSRRLLASAENLTMKINSKFLFDASGIRMYSNDRIILTGDNGSGKTSLLNLFIQKDKQLYFSEAVQISLLQQQATELPSNTRVLNYFRAQIGLNESESRGYLDRLLFSQDEVFIYLSQLSHGQITRLCLCIAILQNPDLLLLDEPTNHLDVSSIGVVQKLLQEYRGAFIVVTHDQELINSLQATSIWSIVDKKLVITENV